MMRRSCVACAIPIGYKPFRKIMVANRGEIACRVFRTAKAMGISTVGVYCDAEKNGKHVQHADEAYRLGPPPAATSYLNVSRILEVAQNSGVDAIHPGYGFLSENSEFARACSKAAITFIGPPASAIDSMGSKADSKKIMTDAQVPCVPGYHGEDQSVGLLEQEAGRIGFPILIKAAFGGGGKGMKIVRTAADFLPMLQSAKREAKNYFKNDRIIIEKYIERPRHVECQIFCDMHGNGCFLFERDCSVQRRYQKVIEEAPAPKLSPEIRSSIGEIALKAAKAVGYVGAGTVEFIFDTDTGNFYFMEMNTRLQVEHPVTEEVVRVKGRPLDLVRLQIETAMGHALDFVQSDVTIDGHCVEARVYAESPAEGFLPGSGKLKFVREPETGEIGAIKVRLDTGFRSGDSVLVHYDPMIAKLIVWGQDRPAALRGLRLALNNYHICGIETNIEFLKNCCDDRAFQEGGVTTKFIEEHKGTLLASPSATSVEYALAALLVFLQHAPGQDGFRMSALQSAHLTVQFLDDKKQPQPAIITWTARGKYKVTCHDGRQHILELCPSLDPASTAVFVDNSSQRIEFSGVVGPAEVSLMMKAGTKNLKLQQVSSDFGRIKGRVHGGESIIRSPMPGKLSKYLVANGEKVVRGEALCIVEAMKMEHVVSAPVDGVAELCAVEGVMVDGEQILARIKPLPKEKK